MKVTFEHVRTGRRYTLDEKDPRVKALERQPRFRRVGVPTLREAGKTDK